MDLQPTQAHAREKSLAAACLETMEASGAGVAVRSCRASMNPGGTRPRQILQRLARFVGSEEDTGPSWPDGECPLRPSNLRLCAQRLFQAGGVDLPATQR